VERWLKSWKVGMIAFRSRRERHSQHSSVPLFQCSIIPLLVWELGFYAEIS
jgi:hypothetical protein